MRTLTIHVQVDDNPPVVKQVKTHVPSDAAEKIASEFAAIVQHYGGPTGAAAHVNRLINAVGDVLSAFDKLPPLEKYRDVQRFFQDLRDLEQRLRKHNEVYLAAKVFSEKPQGSE